MNLILTVVAIFALLVASEYWWRTRKPHDEVSRKFVHIAVGVFAAFWPFYLSWNEILLLSAAFISVVALSKVLHIFDSIHSVQRPTWGEICFAVAIGVIVFITREPWVYAAAVLHMGVADGFAAIIGVAYGKRTAYKVFGHTKSIVGSLTFFVISVSILSVYSFMSVPLSIGLIVMLASVTTLLENISVRGLDNLFVPVLIAIVLQQQL